MSLSAQAKVLRALQESKITRVGGDKEITVNVRVVAATNKDLRNEINENRFREDLYHRLSVIVIKVPSLNERKDDISLLTERFLEDIAEEHGAKKKVMSAKALEGLKAHNWTGNIRELRNVIERLVIMSGDEITAQDVEKYL
jgi:DNA-binding NtrC family response regulator